MTHCAAARPVAPARKKTVSRNRLAGKALPWAIGALLLVGVAAAVWWRLGSHGGQEPGQVAQQPGGPASGVRSAAGDGGARPGRDGPSGFQGRPPGGGGPGGFGGPGGPRFGGGGGNRVQPVSVAVVRQQDIQVKVNAIGNIAAANTAVVKAKIEGELKAIHFQEGQFVKAGALLAEIDPRAWQIALAQAEGQLARDRALLQNAQLDLARFKDLLAKDGIARQQVDTQEALVRQLQGTVQSDQAQVDNAKLALSYTRITAPIAGRVGLKQADLGNVVKPADPLGLLSIAQTRPVNVVFSVPDAHLTLIQSQLKAGRPLAVEAWDRSQTRRLGVGQVASTDNAIDATTSTLKLKAAFANDDDGLFPNQFVNVRLALATVADTLAVPSAAVLRNEQGDYVYRVNDDKTVSVRRVQAGASDGEWVAVQARGPEGLKAGDRVVVDGVDRLREGATVDVIRPGGAAVAQAGGAQALGPQAGGSRGDGVRAERGAAPTALAQAGGDRADFLSRLPPDVAERVKAMSPDERRAFFQQRRAEREAREGRDGGPREGGAVGASASAPR
jgi:multidrug efflux system membrane fusion protein